MKKTDYRIDENVVPIFKGDYMLINPANQMEDFKDK